MTTIVGGICPRCGQFHDLFLAVDGSIVCRNADGTVERLRQLEAERDAARAEVERLRSPEWEAEVRADERARAYPGREVRYQDIKGQPGHERNPEYWDGVLDGLDVAEQIVEKEAQS